MLLSSYPSPRAGDYHHRGSDYNLAIKRLINRCLRRLGYEIRKVPQLPALPSPPPPASPLPAPPPLEPVWPLPRDPKGPSDDEIRREFARHRLWHYAYAFEGGLSFPAVHDHPYRDTNNPVRPLQAFRHFMPDLVRACGGTLKGKRVLDIACNSGFFSLQCALLGAEVVGFDARPELIEEANLLKRITGIANVEYRVLDFSEMTPETLGGTFDVVLNLGLLYHLPETLEALERTKAMARERILLDTAVHTSGEAAIYLNWEEPCDIRMAVTEGIVAAPTKAAVELMLKHLQCKSWFEIPIRSQDLPDIYLTRRRISWLIDV